MVWEGQFLRECNGLSAGPDCIPVHLDCEERSLITEVGILTIWELIVGEE